MEPITPEQYSELSNKGTRKRLDPLPAATTSTPFAELKKHLRAFGEYFDVDRKSIEFYIRQLELIGKL